MLYTVLMNLQHRHLTADNQRELQSDAVILVGTDIVLAPIGSYPLNVLAAVHSGMDIALSQSDTCKMLADIIYESISIKTRLLSLDDDGRPVVLYYVTPQLSYDITYRGDLAATAAEKDIDVHQTGVYEPPVYVAVYVE